MRISFPDADSKPFYYRNDTWTDCLLHTKQQMAPGIGINGTTMGGS